MGLLDFLYSDDPKQQALNAMAFGLLSGSGHTNRNFGADLGNAGLLGLQSYSVQKTLQAKLAEEAQQKQMRDLQMQQMQRANTQQQQIDALAPKFMQPGMPQMQPTDYETPSAPPALPTMDWRGYSHALTGIDPMRGLQLQSTLAALQARDRQKLGKGEVLTERQDNGTYKTVAQGAPDLPPGMTMGPNGPIFMPEYIKGKAEIAAAGRPSVNVTTGTTMASELGKGAGDVLNTGRTSAISAVDTITTGNQVRQALDSGKVMAGPGTSNIKIPLAQVAPMFGLPSDQEGLVKTRQVITGMANQALNARGLLKGQGQISDFEGRVLEKAKAGNIDAMTVPEIRALVDVNERAARVQIQRHNAMVDQLAKNPQFAEAVPFFRVDEPPAYSQQKSALTPQEQAELAALRKRFGR